MKFTGTFQAPRLNLARYRSLLADELRTQISRAAAIWLGTVTKIVPVWSGASHGTFLQLASQAEFDLAISQASGAPSRVDLGLENSTGQMIEDIDKGLFLFQYETTLKHLIINEFRNVNIEFPHFFHLKRPGPYHFQLRGQEAFEKFAESVTLPNPFAALDIKTIKVG